jgi:hypothetical protein
LTSAHQNDRKTQKNINLKQRKNKKNPNTTKTQKKKNPGDGGAKDRIIT